MPLQNGLFLEQGRYFVIRECDVYEAVREGFLGMSTPLTLLRILDGIDLYRASACKVTPCIIVIEEQKGVPRVKSQDQS